MPTNTFAGRSLNGASYFAPCVYADKGAISSSSPYATAAGLEMLKKGGNAFDAAVAVALVLGVVHPFHSGIGGGAFTVFYHKGTDSYYSIDARGVAPLKAYRDMFLNDKGEVDFELSDRSGRAVAVPLFYKSMDKLLRSYGTMSLMEVSEPAIRLAEQGFNCGFIYERCNDSTEAEHFNHKYEGFGKLFLNHGKPYRLGQLIKNPELAATMRTVAEQGVEAFYNGPIADDIVREVNAADGLLTNEDLLKSKVKMLTPVRGSYRNYDIVSMPPPSSGGTHIIQMLNILENFDLKDMGHLSADSIHVIAEAMKLMFADRSVAMGDPDFVKVDVERLTDKNYAGELAAKIDMKRAGSFAPTKGIEAMDLGSCTTHFSIMDSEGNVLSQTQTVRSWWGSGVVVRGRGFLLNNTMSDFSAKVGAKTTQGLAYGTANGICPGKTPLSSMSPSILIKDGKPVMAVGAAGGPRIITSTLMSILNVVDYKLLPLTAITTPHICSMTLEQGLELEYGISPDTIKELKARGHKIIQVNDFGFIRANPNCVMRIANNFYSAGTNRADGGGSGALTKDGAIVLDGINFI